MTDTIVALATAPGVGALAIVRVAGPGAFGVMATIAPGFDPARPREARLLRLVDPAGATIDRGLVTLFPAPHSFSGDDTVECTVHGGALAATRVIDAALAAGARPALPGEFTRRAVLNGKLDLLQAEAVGDLITATAPAQADIALRQLDGALSRRIGALREALLQTEALLAYMIDFPEEDDGPVAPARPRAALADLDAQLHRLLESATDGERLRQGAMVVLAGRPNAGKSSLFNALLGRSRALVTEIPGTTRDAIEADLVIDGWPIRLVDTAGLHEATDRIEAMGIEVSRGYLERADLVLFCVSPEEQTAVSEWSFTGDERIVVVATKADLGAGGDEAPQRAARLESVAALSQGFGLSVSAETGEGLLALRTELVARLYAGLRRSDGAEPVLTRARHRVGVQRALAEVGAAAARLEEGEPVLAAQALRGAVLALDAVIGVVDREELFDRVFSGFCIGK